MAVRCSTAAYDTAQRVEEELSGEAVGAAARGPRAAPVRARGCPAGHRRHGPLPRQAVRVGIHHRYYAVLAAEEIILTGRFALSLLRTGQNFVVDGGMTKKMIYVE